jgi:cell division protein FtsB
MEPEKGHRWKTRLPFLVACGIAALALLYSFFREMGVVGTWKLYRTQAQILEENARLREKNKELSQEVRNLRTNPAYIEQIAREKHGLIGDKEKVIVLDRKANPAPPPAGGADRR